MAFGLEVKRVTTDSGVEQLNNILNFYDDNTPITSCLTGVVQWAYARLISVTPTNAGLNPVGRELVTWY